MINKTMIDKLTGEIKEFHPSIPFRSITDLKSCSDFECDFPESIVKLDGYEDVNHLVGRMQAAGIRVDDLVQDDGERISDEEADKELDIDEQDFEDLTDYSDAANHLAEVFAADFSARHPQATSEGDDPQKVKSTEQASLVGEVLKKSEQSEVDFPEK